MAGKHKTTIGGTFSLIIKLFVLAYAWVQFYKVKLDHSIETVHDQMPLKDLGEEPLPEDYVNFNETKASVFFLLKKSRENKFIPYDDEVEKHVSFVAFNNYWNNSD